MSDLHISLTAEELFAIGPFSVTNSFVMMLIVMAGIILFGRWIASRLQEVPTRKQGAVEMVVEFLLNLVEATAGKTLGRRVFPLISSLFIFIIIANYTGLLPGVGTIGVYHEYHSEEPGVIDLQTPSEAEENTDESGFLDSTYDVAALMTLPAPPTPDLAPRHAEEGGRELIPFMRPPTADLNMTLSMALIAFTMVQVFGVRTHGVVGRLKHMADPPFMFPIELISELARIISLSARLFGNIFAGEVLLTVMFTLAATVRLAVVPLAVPIVFLGLELLFGFIQALVFALLTLIYITLAAASHGHGDHAHGDGHHAEPGRQPVPVAATGD